MGGTDQRDNLVLKQFQLPHLIGQRPQIDALCAGSRVPTQPLGTDFRRADRQRQSANQAGSRPSIGASWVTFPPASLEFSVMNTQVVASALGNRGSRAPVGLANVDRSSTAAA